MNLFIRSFENSAINFIFPGFSDVIDQINGFNSYQKTPINPFINNVNYPNTGHGYAGWNQQPSGEFSRFSPSGVAAEAELSMGNGDQQRTCDGGKFGNWYLNRVASPPLPGHAKYAKCRSQYPIYGFNFNPYRGAPYPYSYCYREPEAMMTSRGYDIKFPWSYAGN